MERQPSSQPGCFSATANFSSRTNSTCDRRRCEIDWTHESTEELKQAKCNFEAREGQAQSASESLEITAAAAGNSYGTNWSSTGEDPLFLSVSTFKNCKHEGASIVSCFTGLPNQDYSTSLLIA